MHTFFGTVLNIYWHILIHPLILLSYLVIGFMFTFVAKSKIDKIMIFIFWPVLVFTIIGFMYMFGSALAN